MDFRRNESFSGEIPANYQPEQRVSLDDLFTGHSMEESDINTEWLSIFVEDCLSSSGSCIPLNPQSTTSNAQGTTTTTTTTEANSEVKKKNISMHKPVVSCKAARSKRKRSKFKGTSHLCWFQQYPPLLHQTYWLADSELILPNKSTSQQSTKSEDYGQKRYKEIKQEEEEEEGSTGQGRRCSHCLSQRTPQWRAGPEGPKTLCNACGVRYKSGRLLPEYRPAKSPSFVSYKHSNSHKKVLEMRMCSSSFS